MILSEKIRKGVETHPEITAVLKSKSRELRWQHFTRTQFNMVARVINKVISREIQETVDLVEMHLIIGKQQLEKELNALRLNSVHDFVKHIGNFRDYRVFNWVSGKTLQSYWQGGEAKHV